MRPHRPNPPHGAGIAPARWLAAAAGILAATASDASADDQPRPAANIQQARAKFAATNAFAFVQAPVAESIKAALALPGKSRLAESIDAVRSLANDLRGDRPGAVVRALITGADDGTHCPVDPGDPNWMDPPTVRPAGGRTYVRLSAQFAESSIGPDRIRHRSYNGALVGPVIRVRPGDTLVVDLVNNLPPEPPAPAPAGAPPGAGAAPPQKETPHGFNTTNLHTHGLHVSPLPGSDDVFLELRPGARPPDVLRFTIPADHPAGTFWYHPHKHGSAAIQLTSGMAGALIVEGGIDDYPQIRGAAEKVMVLQQVVYQTPSAPGQIVEIRPEDVYSSLSPGANPLTRTLINGQLVPVITMRPGEVQRWRMIHSGIQTEINVNFPGGKMIEVAYDGIPLKVFRPVVGPSKLEPGYRVDLLVKASNQPGVYCVYNSVTDPLAFNGQLVAPKVLAKVVIEGPAANIPLPDPADWTSWVENLYTQMPDLRDVPAPGGGAGRRTLDFSVDVGTAYTIGGMAFDPDRIDQKINLGAEEEWTLKSSSGIHPFHIHANPFQVQAKYPDGVTRWVWRDTLLFNAVAPATIRSRFLDFPGKTVLHCHNIDHEDQGMMSAICLFDPKASDKDCKTAAPAPAPGTPPGAGAPHAAAARDVSSPAPAPAWQLVGAGGRESTSAGTRGRRHLLVFHRGFTCGHCAEQVALLGDSARAFRDLGVDVLVVSPAAKAGDKPVAIPGGPDGLTILGDPSLDAFRAYGCLTGAEVLHGIFLIDADGLIRWGRVGDRPETDVGLILAHARRLTAPRAAAVGR